MVTYRIFRGSRHGGSSTEFAERAAKRGTPRNAHGTGMLSAPRKAAEGRGRPRKVAGGRKKAKVIHNAQQGTMLVNLTKLISNYIAIEDPFFTLYAQIAYLLAL